MNNNREEMEIELQIKYENLCEKGWSTSFELFQNAYQLGQDAALASQAQQPAFPPRYLTKPAEQQGMFSKFHVERVDGSSAKGGKHHGCRYWVLDLDHDKHAPAAMRGYAEDCKETHPVLSAEIFAEFGMQSQAQQTESNLHWCGTCEQNVERGCGDSACQYRYKLPPAPEGDKS